MFHLLLPFLCDFRSIKGKLDLSSYVFLGNLHYMQRGLGSAIKHSLLPHVKGSLSVFYERGYASIERINKLKRNVVGHMPYLIWKAMEIHGSLLKIGLRLLFGIAALKRQ